MKTSMSGDRPFASPAAKQLAAERGIDLVIILSGPKGMDTVEMILWRGTFST
jgi:hypothetical protein